MAILDTVSDTTWKWRCKVSNAVKGTDRTLADFSAPLPPTDSDASDKSQDEKYEPPAKAKSRDAPPGFTAAVKTLYEGPSKRGGGYNWVDYPPRQLSKSEAKAQSRVAIRTYKIRDTSKPMISGYCGLKYHMVEIQNSLLIEAINEAMKKQSLNLDANETATFHAPFQSLFFGYDNIVAKSQSLQNGDPLLPFLLLLIRLLDEIFAETRAKLRHLRSKGLVSYDLAWAYFPRDTVAITSNNGDALCKVIDTTYTATTSGDVMTVQAEAVNFDGRAFVWENISLDIPKFSGNKPVAELRLYPLEFHRDPHGVKEKLTARGKKVLDYQGLTHCNYTGIALYGLEQRHNVSYRRASGRKYYGHQLTETRSTAASSSTLPVTISINWPRDRGTAHPIRSSATQTCASPRVRDHTLGDTSLFHDAHESCRHIASRVC